MKRGPKLFALKSRINHLYFSRGCFDGIFHCEFSSQGVLQQNQVLVVSPLFWQDVVVAKYRPFLVLSCGLDVGDGLAPRPRGRGDAILIKNCACPLRLCILAYFTECQPVVTGHRV